MIATDPHTPLQLTRKRYASLALIVTVISGGALILLGFAPLGKGLILGGLFSVVNFILMALVLPYRLGHGRGKSFLLALSSIYFRFAVMAVPLIFAIKDPRFSVFTVAIGLFMIPITILSDHLWLRWRHSEEVRI